MKFKGKVVISKQNLCKKDMGEADPFIEESLILSFEAEKCAELAGMKPAEMKAFFGDNENKEFSKGTGAFILSNVFNLTISGRYKFKGVKFSSCVIKMVKKIGTVINLHCRLEYGEEFHGELPALLNSVADIEINSVNEQMKMPEGDK